MKSIGKLRNDCRTVRLGGQGMGVPPPTFENKKVKFQKLVKQLPPRLTVTLS